MKRSIVFLMVIALFTGIEGIAQKAEVLYFKANLACCQARSCDAIESDVKAAVEKSFTNGEVLFKVLKLADAANKELVEKYHAKSQTVVVVATKKKKVTSVDISDIVRDYSRNRNKDLLEQNLIAKVNECMK
jgi:DNA-binding protein YbaB